MKIPTKSWDWKFKIEKEYPKEDYTKEEAEEQFIEDIAHNNFDFEEVV